MQVFPVYPEELTPEFMTASIGELHPDTLVSNVTVVEAVGFGDIAVSTSARVDISLEYSRNPADLPERAIIKMVKTNEWPSRNISLRPGVRQRPPRSPLYENEVNFYRNIGAESPVEIPRVLAARMDQTSGRFVLVLENVASRGAHFPTQFDEASVEEVEGLLSQLARLHANYWKSCRFRTDLAWIQTPTRGAVADMLRTTVRAAVGSELAAFKFKREFLGSVGLTERELFEHLDALEKHQERLPGTLIHGDPHFGNTYRLPDGRVGFLDWQLAVCGFGIHDVSYLMITALSIAQRREFERELLGHYREQLLMHNIPDVPCQEDMWLEYRRAAHWCVTIGWLPCPPVAYGWELVVVANQRTFTAYADLECRRAIEGLL